MSLKPTWAFSFLAFEKGYSLVLNSMNKHQDEINCNSVGNPPKREKVQPIH